MNVSKALPIEFYLNGKVVYNDKTSPFMDFKKFFQKVRCTDEVKIQFTDTEQHSYILRFLDENDTAIDTVTFVQASYPGFYRYTASFIFQSLGICDQKVKMEIFWSEVSMAINTSDLLETLEATIVVSNSISIGLTDLLETLSMSIANFTSDSFKLENSLGAVCSAGLTTLYWNGGAFGEGRTMYTDEFLTTPVTGFDFIALASAGEIFNLDDLTGVVGTTTGNFC
jgi:hypothetical protein